MVAKYIKNSGLYLKRIQNGLTLNILVHIFSVFGSGFGAYYFMLQGVELYKIISIWAIGPIISLPVLAFSNTWNVKTYLRLGLLCYTGTSLSLFFYNDYSFLLYAIFDGFSRMGVFWVSLNYIFFLNSNNENHGRDSSVYFILGPLLGIVMPPLAALFIDNLGFRMLFLTASLLSLIPLLYVRGPAFEHTVKQSFRDADRRFAGLRLICLIDAALHFFQHHFLAIYALLFLRTEYEVGGLLSYLAFLSLIVAFLVSYVSDKRKDRVKMLYPLLIMMSILMLVMPTFDNVGSLVVAIGLYALLDNLSMPLRFAIPMDMVEKDIGFWRINEFWGNLGRAIVFAIATLLILIGNYWLAFGFFAAITFAFPFIISWKINWMRKAGLEKLNTLA